MTEDEAIQKLDAIEGGDQENAHGEADDVLLAFLKANGFMRLAQAWHDVDDRCGGFWYA